MKNITIGGIFLAAIISLVLFVPKAQANELHQNTLLTFSQAVQIPGNRVLAAGSYWFVLLEPRNGLNTVAIYNADQSVREDVLVTEPIYRATPSAKTQVTLVKQGQKTPDALLSWFYPDMQYGHKLSYSPRMERRINEDAKLTVQVPLSAVQG